MKYLMTLNELSDAAIRNLGPMDQGTFADFKAKAVVEATKTGIKNPRLVIDIKLNEVNALGTKEMPYPISEGEWNIFVSDARTMAEYMPRVFVVDGDKFTAPI